MLHALRLIANTKDNPEGWATDEQIAHHYLNEIGESPNDKLCHCAGLRERTDMEIDFTRGNFARLSSEERAQLAAATLLGVCNDHRWPYGVDIEGDCRPRCVWCEALRGDALERKLLHVNGQLAALLMAAEDVISVLLVGNHTHCGHADSKPCRLCHLRNIVCKLRDRDASNVQDMPRRQTTNKGES